jgi:hypothetical protein
MNHGGLFRILRVGVQEDFAADHFAGQSECNDFAGATTGMQGEECAGHDDAQG